MYIIFWTTPFLTPLSTYDVCLLYKAAIVIHKKCLVEFECGFKDIALTYVLFHCHCKPTHV